MDVNIIFSNFTMPQALMLLSIKLILDVILILILALFIWFGNNIYTNFNVNKKNVLEENIIVSVNMKCMMNLAQI